jgi:hypothetical protein
MQIRKLSIAMVLTLTGAAVMAACGGGEMPSPTNVPPNPTSSETAEPTTPPTPPDTPPPVTPSASATPPDGPKSNLFPDVTATKFEADLKEAGLDLAKIKPMKMMKGKEKAKVMKVIAKSMGMECKDCHVDGKPKAYTRNKAIAEKMWDQFVVPHKAEGGAVFCDSCHQGSAKNLDRGNREKVSDYMKQYTSKLMTKKKGGEVKCDTCHTKDFEMKIVEKLWKIKPLAS